MNRDKPGVVWWSLGVSHYVVGMFNAVARRNNLRFEVWFNNLQLAGRSWGVNLAEWEFAARVIPRRSLLGKPMQVPTAELREVRPELLVSGYFNASWILGAFAALSQGARTAFYPMPTFEAWSQRSRGKEILKHFLFRAVDGVAVPGIDAAAYSRHYGAPADRTLEITKSIDVAHYARARNLGSAARQRARQRLGLRGCVFVYVGRLWSGKGLDYLFDAYREVRVRLPEVSLLVLGDGVDEARYREMAHQMVDVVFTGFVQPSDVPGWYALADVMVFPTLGDPHGQVVEEAMAAGLPVICTESAGSIRHRLPDGEAGYIVPARDASALAHRMAALARDAATRAKFGRAGAQIACGRSHERFAQDLERFVDILLAKPRRGTPQAMLARRMGSLVCAAAGSTARTAPLAHAQGGRSRETAT